MLEDMLEECQKTCPLEQPSNDFDEMNHNGLYFALSSLGVYTI